MSVKAKKEYVSVINERIEQKEIIEYKVEYGKVNYYEYEHKQEVDCIKSRPCLIDCEYIVCEIIEDQNVEYCEMIEDEKVEYCEVTEDQKVEYCEIIEYQKVEYYEMIEDQKVKYCEIIEDQKVEYCEIIEDQKVVD